MKGLLGLGFLGVGLCTLLICDCPTGIVDRETFFLLPDLVFLAFWECSLRLVSLFGGMVSEWWLVLFSE